MKKLIIGMLAATMVASTSVPASAGWKMIDKDEEVKVAKSSMRATPTVNWNRWTVRPVKKSEVWTLDGVNLNELYFVSGLPEGKTLFRDVRKKEQPLPKVSASMDLTEIPDFVESSTRVALNTSVFEMTSIEPTTLGGEPAVRFTYNYAVEGSSLKRRGMGVGTMKSGALHLVTFVAPEMYYFERDLPKVDAILASLTL